jgi:hypothetical protein
MNVHRKLRGLLLLTLVAGWVQAELAAAEAITPGQAAVGSLRGLALAPDGVPLAGVGVVIRSLAGAPDRRLLSDQTGVFVVNDLQPGQYEITAHKEGLTSARAVTVEVAQNTLTEATVALVADTRGQALSKNTEGQPLTDREKGLLDRIDSLEKRLAAMEAKDATEPKNSPRSEPATGKALTASANPTAVVRGPEKPERLATAPAATEKAPEAANGLPKPVPVEVAQNQTAQPALPPTKSVEPASAVVAPPPVDNQTPFAYGDFTWLNGTPRNKDVAVDTPFFTPEIRFDTHFMQSFNQPRDHTMGGSTESFRSGEFQVEQISVGGDFHWQNVRGRILTMFGLFATTTPRNDASPGNGQWDLRNAYRYVSEAYGGYHFNVNHGLNADAGIFVSYIGLFSYYNFDNWTYQPSYVSSNTPWFFNGLRIQWFPTNKLKIEPWIINGWQSYARANGHHGFGGQILWMPKEWLKFVFNNYGNGTDALGVPSRVRLHTDDSVEVRYYNKPESTGVSKMAFSFTADAGCEYGPGSGVSCTGKGGQPKQAFLGWMAYNRFWFHKDLFAITPGGGMMNNPGRYLTLLPPINGADAISGSPYFSENPADKAHMWDTTLNIQYMPKQYVTWWAEFGYRHSDVPYFSGRGGITPPGGNNGVPTQFVCNTGAPSGANDLTTAYANCGGPGSVWFPDLRRGQAVVSVGVLVKF